MEPVDTLVNAFMIAAVGLLLGLQSRSIRAEVRDLRHELRQEITGARTEARDDLSEFRTEVRQEIAEVREELRSVRSDLTAVALAVGAGPSRGSAGQGATRNR